MVDDAIPVRRRTADQGAVLPLPTRCIRYGAGAHESPDPRMCPDVFIVSADPDAEVIRVRMMKGLATDED